MTMTTSPKKSRWWLLVLLLLLGWWWLRRRKPATTTTATTAPGVPIAPVATADGPASVPIAETFPTTTAPVISPPTPAPTVAPATGPQGGYQAPYATGAYGDVNNQNMQSLAPESIARLNEKNYYSVQNGAEMPIGLYDAWRNILQNGGDTTDVLAQIHQLLTGGRGH
jgi:hypothetical protein